MEARQMSQALVDNTGKRSYPYGKIARSESEIMEVLWGAWARDIFYKPNSNEISILGIYDTISKNGKKDFPFTTNLLVVVAYRTYPIEYSQTFKITLKMLDLDMTPIFSQDEQIKVPTIDELTWYESYQLNNIEIQQPGNYELDVLVNDDRKQYFPLHVCADRITILDLENDSYEEKWLEDTDLGKPDIKDVNKEE